MRRNINPDEDLLNTGTLEKEEVNEETSETEAVQQRQNTKEKAKTSRQQKAYAGGEQEKEEDVEEAEEGEWEEEEEEETEEEEQVSEEDIDSIIEEKIDAISEKVKNYIMKTSDNQKMKDLVKYGSLAALAIYGLRRGGLLRGLVVSTAVSMAAKHFLGEKGKTAAA